MPKSLPEAVDGSVDRPDDPVMTDGDAPQPERGDIDPREAARIRRRDRDAAAEARALMRPGIGKVFKQIQDTQARAAKEPPKRKKRPRA